MAPTSRVVVSGVCGSVIRWDQDLSIKRSKNSQYRKALSNMPKFQSSLFTSQSKTIIIGGGFYGCCLAMLCKAAGHKVTLLETGSGLLQRASYVNQARIHYGYHYPRSFLTAVRSAINFPRFVADFRLAVVDDFIKLYAISSRGSKVTADQFYGFAKKVGAPIREAPPEHSGLFNRDMIERVFSVTEYAFDAAILGRLLREKINAAGVTVLYNTTAKSVSRAGDGLLVTTQAGERLGADQVFVATYAGINTLLRNSDLPQLPMKHEITELALVRHAPPLDGMGVTVMDGAFFSTMPFPDRKAHSFTHVRYTPHGSWLDAETPQDPYLTLQNRHPQSTYPLMVKDAQRYLPAVSQATYLESLFEVKTVLTQNEGNDGRPILLRRDYSDMQGLSVVMGGKIDNIYDIVEALGSLREAAEAREPNWITHLLSEE